MDIASRKFNKECIEFRKHLRKPLGITAQLMPADFTDKQFYETFKLCYQHLWADIRRFCSEKAADYKRRKAKGKKAFSFPSPDDYLIKISKPHISNIRIKRNEGMTVLDGNTRAAQIEELKNKSGRKLKRRKNNLAELMRYRQEAIPQHANHFIKEYFHIRRKDPLDINSRFLIIREASHFKCPQTIEFLEKIKACEKNNYLRNMAFNALQGFGVQVGLARKRKGKQKLSMTKVPTLADTPGDLLNAIYNSQMEQGKKYDLFISHSSYDEQELIKLKAMLNSLGLTVYIDWVNDRESLGRDTTGEDTARVIRERIAQCHAIMYVLTDNCLQSRWAPWELGYADGLGKAICIYQPNAIDGNIPPYYDVYDKGMIDEDGGIRVNGLELKEWIRSKKKQYHGKK